jgi:hypothetical protein
MKEFYLLFIKYIIHSTILYLFINHKLKDINKKNTIIICIISSFIFFAIDSYNNDYQLNKKDFLSDLNSNIILN